MFNTYNPYTMYNAQRFNPVNEQPQYVQQNQQTFSTIPVSNKEEANAYRVDVYGTPTFFYNAAKNEIYLKRTNNTGLTDFITFGIVREPVKDEKVQSGNILPEKELQAINDKLDVLYSLLQKPEVVKDDKGAKNAK